jgi:hypothetical protein
MGARAGTGGSTLLLPASLNDVANDLFAKVTRAIETAAFLGLNRTMIEQVLHEALAEVQVPDAPSDG